MKRLKKGFWLVLLMCISFWFLSLLKCEILTWQYGAEFIGLDQQTNMLVESDYLKVLNYSDNRATVYYVAKNLGGDTLVFEKQEGVWKCAEWNTIWSDSGSAEGVQWPYIFDYMCN